MTLPNLSNAEEDAYRATLVSAYEKQVRIELLDRTGDIVEDLSAVLTGGNVTYSGRDPISRAATVTVLDPEHRFGFDADSYYGSDLNLTRMIRVAWVTDGPLQGDAVEVGMVTGPTTSISRNGPEVRVDISGREVVGLQGARRTLHLKKNMRATDALRELAAVYLDDPKVRIPDLRKKLGSAVTIRPKDVPWNVMRRIADSLDGRDIDFDGDGILRLRRFSPKPRWHFTTGPGGSLLSPLSTDADIEGITNAVRVIGKPPKGKDRSISYTAAADPSHQFSAKNIGLRRREVNNPHCRSERDCRVLAEKLLDRGLTLERAIAYDAAAIPDLDPGVPVRVSDENEDLRHGLAVAEYDLGPSLRMKVGWTGNYRRPKRKRRLRAELI